MFLINRIFPSRQTRVSIVDGACVHSATQLLTCAARTVFIRLLYDDRATVYQ